MTKPDAERSRLRNKQPHKRRSCCLRRWHQYIWRHPCLGRNPNRQDRSGLYGWYNAGAECDHPLATVSQFKPGTSRPSQDHTKHLYPIGIEKHRLIPFGHHTLCGVQWVSLPVVLRTVEMPAHSVIRKQTRCGLTISANPSPVRHDYNMLLAETRVASVFSVFFRGYRHCRIRAFKSNRWVL